MRGGRKIQNRERCHSLRMYDLIWGFMQTTLTIDDDILQAAEEIAARKKKPLGTVISDLTRQALAPSGPPYEIRDGIPVLRVSDQRPVTLEFVNQLRDEIS